ncbi:MAG: DNA topoisomerase IB [Hyphomicrobiales bacterium]|nr:DNA topoisomerase IB [Hyphomicrobiales bacterium]
MLQHADVRNADLDRLQQARRSARRASLAYVTDADPGIRRMKAGTGFAYLRPNGRPVSDRRTLERIAALVIPPAWTDVWIAADAHGHIQATGRDLRGRKQYRYHARWSERRDDIKYSSLAGFARALPGLRKRVDADLRRRDLPRERVVASIVWLLDNTMIRVGNASYARDNKSFGLTTLRSRHVSVEGAKLRFAFRGKSGKEWNLKLVDRRIARTVRAIQELPGQHLFQYVDDTGERRSVRSQDVNDYIRDATGGEFSSKHFRTWGGTVRALSLLAEIPLPDSKSGVARALNIAIDEVARHLGNTRAVCRRCYVHPLAIHSWSAGRLAGELATASNGRRRRTGLDAEEAGVLRWLETTKA